MIYPINSDHRCVHAHNIKHPQPSTKDFCKHGVAVQKSIYCLARLFSCSRPRVGSEQCYRFTVRWTWTGKRRVHIFATFPTDLSPSVIDRLTFPLQRLDLSCLLVMSWLPWEKSGIGVVL